MISGGRTEQLDIFCHVTGFMSAFSEFHSCGTSLVTGHYLHAPFHASVLRPASQVGSMHKNAGMGKLSNAALLSLINEACVISSSQHF